MNRRRQTNTPDGTNRPHFACFRCRLAFKQRGSAVWDPEKPLRPFPCPTCHQPMVWMGKYFKAPPRRAVRQWQKVELLYTYGERFDGWSGSTRAYSDLRSAIAALVERGNSEAEVRKTLEAIRRRRS
jgi:hypothetical protein